MIDWLLTVPLVVILVEIFVRLPLAQASAAVLRAGARSVRVLSGGASDHWKEKAIGAYSRRTFVATGRVALMIALVLGIATVLALAFTWVHPGYGEWLLGWEGIAATIVLASIWAIVRRRLWGRLWGRAEPAPSSRYSETDRLLHRLALQSGPVARFLFRRDQKLVGRPAKAVAGNRHVFVSGLARAGTTILMRRIYASGQFRSLTYRDMPFVLAPNLWRKFSSRRGGGEQPVERAHGDCIKVSIDSPESLDEVFWRIFDGEGYIAATHLKPHRPGGEIVAGYARYVNAILNSGESGAERYLSKNNNNILRLPALREAFPNAVILIPFRDPLAHAGSLMRQHANFLEQQADDPFVKEYMSFLGHHEFGGDHRPFRFDEASARALRALSLRTLDYWLEVWMQTYGWLADHAPDDALFVSYEALCADPSVWNRIAHRIGIPGRGGDEEAFSIGRTADSTGDIAPDRIESALALYARLARRAAAQLA